MFAQIVPEGRLDLARKDGLGDAIIGPLENTCLEGLDVALLERHVGDPIVQDNVLGADHVLRDGRRAAWPSPGTPIEPMCESRGWQGSEIGEECAEEDDGPHQRLARDALRCRGAQDELPRLEDDGALLGEKAVVQDKALVGEGARQNEVGATRPDALQRVGNVEENVDHERILPPEKREREGMMRWKPFEKAKKDKPSCIRRPWLRVLGYPG